MTGDRVPVTVVELPDFSALAERLWSPEEREEFVDFIARNPETGKIIAATGGVRRSGGVVKGWAAAAVCA